jgi:hypothetical protein
VLQNNLVGCCLKLKAGGVHDGRAYGPVIEDELAIHVEAIEAAVFSG